MSDPFATAAELAQFLQLAEPTDLARWQQHLAAASALVRRHTGQVLSKVSADVVTLQPTSTTHLYLPERPVTAVTVVEGTVPVTAFTFTSVGQIIRTSGTWDVVATVTYDHGYAEFSPEYEAIKAVVLEVASRSITLNEHGASEAMGSTIMESAGYAPEAFLTQGEKWQLADFGLVGVG